MAGFQLSINGRFWVSTEESATLGDRKSLILKRRDAGAVDQARLENEAGERHQATSKSFNAHAISDLAFSGYHAVCVR